MKKYDKMEYLKGKKLKFFKLFSSNFLFIAKKRLKLFLQKRVDFIPGATLIISFLLILLFSTNSFGSIKNTFIQEEPKPKTTKDIIYDVYFNSNRIWMRLVPNYKIPAIKLYKGSIRSRCGLFKNIDEGAVYCPKDATIYVDIDKFRNIKGVNMVTKEFAIAYALEKAMAKHIQSINNTLPLIQTLQLKMIKRGDLLGYNKLKKGLDLQGDCYIGVWSHYVDGWLIPKEIVDTINKMKKIKLVQVSKKSGGFGSIDSSERIYWYLKGLKSGNLYRCDTFK
ncbi:MAG: hypothetical protein GXO02_03350 [Epsilonproteobacteria bacterium]|nr:hypothetical protein [Campylobacterota bacterium]